ncbi:MULTISPECIES: Lnb N-terminal periplasmic domain-containing protein [Pseudomonadaceae]|jgi:hypothetical protein|uniref:DUF4105 domain-containing protein n=1 Tax=Ectopseudomonas mendocina TaxID=300 RepID=A0ABD7RTS8_ECTME|nr:MULTISPECIES: DUF4105 domain-containing protein [Pseudomonas]OZB34842.1 MAG: DUF4105 domain-containing protein [Pseudomonas sp. 34-62-33]MBG6882727.1 DUF4105 domain-containing protein [Pseudomonas aeruginosa]MBV5858645.1 DUF4105 domain-containing protein [Pseudomonas aeruginosa]MCS9083357.1 DUF4105 domain-containing protein [Pseudomonas aeruginosa]MCT0697494.1 DUF4105 domain-containing protein [Pseudomonas aeruginosa]
MIRHVSRLLLRLALTPLALLAIAWGALTLVYRLDWPAPFGIVLAIGWCLLGAALLVLLWRRPPLWGCAGLLLAFAIHLAWWNTLQPSLQRDWADDVAHTLTGRMEGGRLLLENVRNFHWRSDEDYDVAWEHRAYDLDRLASVDLVTSYWGMPAIAHVIVSFGFDDGRFLAFSVEIRKERGEAYSEIGGFFKQFELSIVAADERDVLRVRSNVRDEDLYLYRLNMSRPAMRALLLSYVEQANILAGRPRFYHTLTANCTTVVFDMARHIAGGLPRDHRLLLTGYLPGYLQDIGALQPGYTSAHLRERGRITGPARAADGVEDFSRQLRLAIPGWEEMQDIEKKEGQ